MIVAVVVVVVVRLMTTVDIPPVVVDVGVVAIFVFASYRRRDRAAAKRQR